MSRLATDSFPPIATQRLAGYLCLLLGRVAEIRQNIEFSSAVPGFEKADKLKSSRVWT
jgi:hypothetical protein